MDKTHLLCGSQFHMDFGFLRASSNSYKKLKNESQVVQSHDGFTSYLLIVDTATCFCWMFPTTSKSPPIDIIDQFFTSQKILDGYCCVFTDQGGKLHCSHKFRAIVAKHHYLPLTTGSNSPHQNGLCECLNLTFGIKVRALLYSSGLPASYWSDALSHSVYLYNRLYHSALHMTPIEAYTGLKPDLTHLQTFGSRVFA